jgi:hypothetical protein
MKTLKHIIVLFLLVTLSACNFNSTYLNRAEDKNDAEIVANRYYGALKNKDYEAVDVFFANEFWKVTPKDKLHEILVNTQSKLGELKSTKLDHWETKVIKGTNPSSEYILYYLNKYKNHEAKETLRLIKVADDKIKIIAFNINSDGFLK